MSKTSGAPPIAAEIMSTPRRLEFKKQLSFARPVVEDTINEEEEYVQAPPSLSSCMRIHSFYIQEDTMQQHSSSFHVAVDVQGFAQVLDCAVVLQEGRVIPIKYLKKAPASPSTSTTTTTSKMTLEMTGEGLATLDDDIDEPIQSITSHGPCLLAKGLSKYFIWMYHENMGTFSKGKTFAMQADGAHAVIENAILGFDVDLPNKKFKAALREIPLMCSDGRVILGDEDKVDGMFLDKGRIKVKKMVEGASGVFLLACKEVRKGVFSGHLFAEFDGQLVKVPGFAEGQIVDLAANFTHLFACTKEGQVYFVDHVDGDEFKKESMKWKEVLGSSHESMGLSSIHSFDQGCIGANGSTAYFLLAGDKSGCSIIKQPLGQQQGESITFIGASRKYAFFWPRSIKTSTPTRLSTLMSMATRNPVLLPCRCGTKQKRQAKQSKAKSLVSICSTTSFCLAAAAGCTNAYWGCS